MNLGILASGKGSNFEALVKEFETDMKIRVKCLVCDQPKAGVIALAQKYEIPSLVFSCDQFRTKLDEATEKKIADYLVSQKVDWVILAGYMRVLKAPMLCRFPDRIVNIHPSLLPSFPGLNAVKQALDYGVKVTGCTVHLVNDKIDQGAILGQKVVPIEEGDNESSLLQRVHQAEHQLYAQMIRKLMAKK